MLMKLEFSRKFLENIQISNFMKISPRGAELVHADGQIGTTKLLLAFRNFSNVPKYSTYFFTIARYTFRPRMSSSDELRERYKMNVASVQTLERVLFLTKFFSLN
jgi:hypothetical protein